MILTMVTMVSDVQVIREWVVNLRERSTANILFCLFRFWIVFRWSLNISHIDCGIQFGSDSKFRFMIDDKNKIANHLTLSQ